MNTITKSLVLTGALAFASSSLYAGNKSSDCEKCCASKAKMTHAEKKAYKAKHGTSHSSKHWKADRVVLVSSAEARPGYVETTKGPRLCTAASIKDRETVRYHASRHDHRTWDRNWNRDVDNTRDRSMRNPS